MKAISYSRFSTPSQSEGDSLRRQDALIASWLKANPEYQLDAGLSFHDAGVSAFRGKNARKGKLARFLKLIEEGKVPSGSVLLIEEWSRFSRDNPYDGDRVSRQVFDAGVAIVDLLNNTRYDAESLRRDMGLRIRLQVEWERSFQEARLKGERVAAAWATKREKAVNGHKPLTRMCPAWLRLVDGKYEIIEDRAATIRLIFQMKADGVGSETIARRLNAMDVWHPEPHAKNRSGGWWPSYIEKIVRNPAVIGTFVSKRQTEPIEQFFPEVVDRDTFNSVAAIRARNAALPGHGASNVNGSVNNLFGGIVRCSGVVLR